MDNRPGTDSPTLAAGMASDSFGGTLTQRRAARIAGIGYVAIFFLAIFANFVVLEGLVVDGDATATAAAITESMGLFRLGFAAFLAVFVLDVVIAWALHGVFRHVHRDLSLLAAWSRLAYTVCLGVALVFYVETLQLLGGAEWLDALGPEQLDAQVMLALESFDVMWLVGLTVFGLHLGILGALLLRSGYTSKVLGVLLVVAGTAYALDTLAHFLLPDYDAVANVFLAAVAVPSVIAEGWLGLWLLLTRRLGR